MIAMAATATHRQGCRTGPVDDRVYRLLAGVGALLAARVEVGDLNGALLDADVEAARVVEIDLLRVALGHDPLGARGVVAHHVDLLLAVGIDGEARDANVELATADAEDDRVEASRLPLDRDAELLGHRVEQVDVKARGGLAVGGEELAGRVARVDAHHDLAGGLDLGWQLVGEFGFLGLRHRRLVAGARGGQRAGTAGTKS